MPPMQPVTPIQPAGPMQSAGPMGQGTANGAPMVQQVKVLPEQKKDISG